MVFGVLDDGTVYSAEEVLVDDSVVDSTVDEEATGEVVESVEAGSWKASGEAVEVDASVDKEEEDSVDEEEVSVDEEDTVLDASLVDEGREVTEASESLELELGSGA